MAKWKLRELKQLSEEFKKLSNAAGFGTAYFGLVRKTIDIFEEKMKKEIEKALGQI